MKFLRHLAQSYTLSHSSLLATVGCPAKGHLNQQRQRRRKPFNEEPRPTPITTRTHTIYAVIVNPKQPPGNSFSDLTGQFPIQSNRGANYIFVLYDYDSNTILV